MSHQRKIKLLAGFLNKSVKIAALNRSVNTVLADGETPSGLKVLRHGEGAEFAYNMYKEYVSDSNFQYFPDFMQKLDTMLFEFRGNQPLEVADDDDEDEDESPRRSSFGSGKRRKKKSKYKPIKKAKVTEPLPPSKDDDSGSDEDSSVVISSTLKRIQEKARQRALR